jgi:rhamnosyl/mannosyltransferase
VRVVHVGKFYPPEYLGGLESVVVGINDELVRRGIGVTAVVAAVKGGSRTDEHHGVRVRRVGNLGTVFSQPITPGFGRAVRDEPGDVLHLHHPNPLADVAIAGDPRPLVITHHSDVVRQAMLRPFYLPAVRGAFARARAITVGSRQLLEFSPELRGFEHKAHVIPFGIDNARFAATDAVRTRAAELRAQWGGGPIVLAVGRLVTYKGFDVLIGAMKGLDATLVIVGTGPEEMRLRALVTSYQLPAASFAGRLPEADLIAAYHAADIFCLPSVTYAEAFGMVLLEAMACGKPLVTTSLPTGVSAVNRHGVTGLQVPPRDVSALREALRQLLADESKRSAMGDAARRVQAEEYSASLMGSRFVQLYEDVIRDS